MLNFRYFYTDFEKAESDMKAASLMGFDAWMYYNPNEKGWYVTFKTLEAKAA